MVALAINVEENVSGYLKDIAGNLVNKATLNKMGRTVIKFVVNRTAKGLDSEGRPFAKYSIRYIIIKGSTLVNLRKTGEMLGSLKHVVTEGGTILIAFSSNSARAKATMHEGGTKNMPPRPFVGITNTQLKILNQILLDHINNLIRTG